MESDFPRVSIGDLVDRGHVRLQTGPFGSQLHKHDYADQGVPVIPTEGIGRGRIRADTVLPRITQAKADELSRHRLSKDDILFARRGIQATGLSALVEDDHVGSICGTGAILLRVQSAEVDPRYLTAVLATNEAFDWLRANAVGAVMPNLNTSIISRFEVPLPQKRIQVEIGRFVSALDERIDLLRQTSTTLEAIAQALFNSWFVDFDPVRANVEGREPEGMDAATAALFRSEFEESDLGLIPKGWRKVPVGTIYDVGIGKTPPRKEAQWFSTGTTDVPWASIRDMGSSGCFLATTSEFLTREAIDRFNVRLVPEETVLMSFKLTVGRLAITDCEMTTNEAIAHFKSKRGSLPQSYLYSFLRSFNMDSLSSTSSIANATNSKAVRQIPLLHPGLALAQAFDEVAGPLIQRIRNKQRQLATLTALRDTLLPRLISGKLRLPEAEAEGRA